MPGTLLQTTLTTGYDLAGQRTSLKADYATGSGFSTLTHDFADTFAYDAKGRMTSVGRGSQGTGTGYNSVANKYVTFGYNDFDEITSIDRYASNTNSNLVAHTDYGYDYLGRLTKIDHQKGTTHLAKYDVVYDSHARISTITDTYNNTAFNDLRTYSYDDTDQLTGVTYSSSSTKNESYGYDKNGNRSGSQTHATTSGSFTGTSTVSNVNQISNDGKYTYLYDAEGNLTKRTETATSLVQEYTWDHRNRLTLAMLKDASGVVTKTVEYRYDHANRLLQRIETPYSGGNPQAASTITTLFTYDGAQAVQEFSATGSATPTLKDRYLWAPVIDHLLADDNLTASTTYWALEDQVGSVRDLATYNAGTNTTSLAKHRVFDSFGNVIQDSAPSVKATFAFQRKYADPVTGLDLHGERWYATWLGKWASEDPIGFLGGQENLSQMVGNHPNYATDPSGLAPNPIGDFFSALRANIKDNVVMDFLDALRASTINNKRALEVHHLFQQNTAFAAWALKMFGKDVNACDNLVLVPSHIHAMITNKQNAFWANWFKTTGTTNIDDALKVIDADPAQLDVFKAQYKSLVNDIDAEFSPYWIRTTSSSDEIVNALKRASAFGDGAADLRSVISQTARTRTGAHRFFGMAIMSANVGFMLLSLKEIASPSASTKVEFDDMINRYHMSLCEWEREGSVSGEYMRNTTDSLSRYLRAAGTDEKGIYAIITAFYGEASRGK